MIRILQHIITKTPTKNYARLCSIKNIPEEAKNEKKKKQIIPRITLISDGDKIEITTLDEAQKLSQRRNLKLVKIVDVDLKTNRPVYKLLSGTQFYEEELKQREEKKAKKGHIKGEKLLSVSSKIASGDLASKAKLVTKWLQKNYEVRVIISRDGADPIKMEQISKEIEKASPTAKVLQKRTNNSDIRFSMVPPKPTEAGKTVTTTPDTSTVDQQIRSYHSSSS